MTPAPAGSAGLYDRPVLVVDPGMHTSMVRRVSVDAAGRWAATASDDKTVRIWSAADGKLVRTLRLPSGPDGAGTALAVAVSPDGTLVAAGGQTQPGDAKVHENIYLFDRDSGEMCGRIAGLDNAVGHLLFSRDGGLLVATLLRSGLRVFARANGWAEVGRDDSYGNAAYGAAFAGDGRLAVVTYLGAVHLYHEPLAGQLRPAVTYPTGGRGPYSVAFTPDGTLLAVGYDKELAVDLLDGQTLRPVRQQPGLAGLVGGDLSSVAWSDDGGTLWAGGVHPPALGKPARKCLVKWDARGTGPPVRFEVAETTILSLAPLPGDDLLVAAADPWFGRVRPDGTLAWANPQGQADLRGQYRTFAAAADGSVVDFALGAFGAVPMRFDLSRRLLRPGPAADGVTLPPRQEGLPLTDCFNNDEPRLAGRRLPLARHEYARSVAVHPAQDRFVLGSDWWVSAYDAGGTPLWRRRGPAAWAVNITGDGRLVVCAFSDGTIRWLRMDTGEELLAFMPLPDGANWVAWTPEGFYGATPGAHGVLRWHVNRGLDSAPISKRISEIKGTFRPDVLPLVLRELETARALGLASIAEMQRQVMIETRSDVPPGARLHLLAIGISVYNPEYAKHLRLHFAHKDAADLASVIVDTQATLYADVLPQVLLDADANKPGILRAFQTMRQGMQQGGGHDLAVVHFSGHGALVDGKLYLLPYEVDARDGVGIKSKALAADELRGELAALAAYGRVLVLLDACHSGATTMDGAAIAMDSSGLRVSLAAPNVTVLTSSSGAEVSREHPDWQHGAFTKVLLDAFDDPDADTDDDGLIFTTGLAHYVAGRVAALTGGRQNPGLELRFDTTVFARAM